MGVKRKYKKFKESDLRETTCSVRKVVKMFYSDHGVSQWKRVFSIRTS